MSTCPASYTCSDKGLLLPLVSEATWPTGARAFIYLIGLLWSFLAIADITNIYISAIAQITSQTKVVKRPDEADETKYKDYEVRRWNDIVANFTLLGPQILFPIIEIVLNDFKSGELGPSVIVGSAALNLAVLCGVCVIVIPSSETRRIKKLKVFVITAVFSVLAYVWLIIILVVNTPDFVDLWEAIVTLLLFPILVIASYIMDKDYFDCSSDEDEKSGFVEDEKSGSEVGEVGGKVSFIYLLNECIKFDFSIHYLFSFCIGTNPILQHFY